MAISFLSLLDTFATMITKFNSAAAAINGLSDGSTTVANTSISGTVVRLVSNTAGISIANPTANIGDTIYMNVGTLSTDTSDVSTINIASANLTNSIFQTALGAFSQANNANITVQSAFNTANTANLNATSANGTVGAAYTQANTSYTLAIQAFGKANSANITADLAFGLANGANITVISVYGLANNTNLTAISAYTQANIANSIANTVASNTNYGRVILANTQGWINASPNNVLTSDQVWASANYVPLTMNTTINLDLSTGINFSINLTSSATLGNPTNVIIGKTGQILIAANGSGKVLSYGSKWKFAANANSTITSNTTAYDILTYSILPSGNAWASLNQSVPK